MGLERTLDRPLGMPNSFSMRLRERGLFPQSSLVPFQLNPASKVDDALDEQYISSGGSLDGPCVASTGSPIGGVVKDVVGNVFTKPSG